MELGGGDVNLYAYVGNDPIDYKDPQGLFRYYGNWCGGDWTGGKRQSYERDFYKVALPAIDELDAACRRHDICYWLCREGYPCDSKARAQCMTTCDRRLATEAVEADNLSNDFYVAWLWLWMRWNPLPQPGPDKPDCCKR